MPVNNAPSFEKILRVSQETIIFFLILFSPLILGGVLIFPLSVLQALSFLLFFLFIFSQLLKDNFSLVKINYLPLFIFLALVIFQLFPLGKTLLSVISPATADLYRNFSSAGGSIFSISIYREATIKLLLEVLCYLSVFFVTLNYFDTEKKQRRLLICIIISGFIYAFYGIISRLYAPESAFSSFSNRNHFAAYMLLVIPLGVAMSSVTVSLAVRTIFSFMSSVMVVGLFLSLSRAGRICFVLGLILFVILLHIRRKAKKAIPVFFILFVFLITFVMLIGAPFFLQRLESVLTPLKAYSNRLLILKDSIQIAGDFPVFGTGLGTYGEIAQIYKTTGWQTSYDFAHNEPIQLLSETGLIGFVSISLFIVLIVYSVFIIWLKRRSHFPSYVTLGCIISLFAFILHSFFDFVFHVPADTLLFFIVLALAFRVVYYKEEQEMLDVPKFEFSLSLSGKAALLFIIFLMVLPLEILVFRRYQAEALFERIEKRELVSRGFDEQINYDDRMEAINKAIALSPLNSKYYVERGDLLAEQAANNEQMQDGTVGQFRSYDLDKTLLAKGDYLKSVALNPTHADWHLRLGWIYHTFFGQPESAKEEFKKALMLDPENLKIRKYIAEFIDLP
ncbi:MAG: O-antigen ligase family protein [Candidatus Omnitrophica bacterium]|nr:O-antigen ligase family protein [Candidatus Omnitrophota bacterium]